MKTVITYGTFDLFHKGHYNILKRAKEEGDYLIVGVTGERYDTERGKLSVKDSLATRIENVRKTGFADKIIVEEYLGQKIPDIIKYNVDVLVIGSDWKGKFDHLNKYCQVKYLERTKDISSTQLREEMQTFKFGIATDDLYDNDNVTEPKHVSGIHVESVFSPDKKTADEFCSEYELYKGYTDYDEFLKSVDIVYVKVKREERAKYVERALLQGKHIVVDPPCTLSLEEDHRLNKLAAEHHVLLLNNLPTIYLQAFGQLLWMARGNLIGDLVSIKMSIAKESFDPRYDLDFYDIAYYPMCVAVKILGYDYTSCDKKLVRDEDGNINYAMINVNYENAVASAEISMDPEVTGGMTIIGTTGTIIVPEDWWRVGYFKLKTNGENSYKRYCFNFEGNGFRYLIQALLGMIRSDEPNSERITDEESDAIIELLNDIR
ncbi:adenylyltransferase/cytidyltransferase family protein [Aminicella lysinilytica]|uniref:Glycerol-3-phosphate cytidylyltransferase n=1 Tax=Aminicella lysinilytica TaxID=433323 RepID=A0A4R6Q7P3_9FIRM|nr:adenylyltransferase/cytidyltransferase family protein [Aminicella lysinilytica]TDP58554.1 glycerol-3-phosphate cytidylyltransferase [Aminicella lysinilytica]